MSSLPGMSTGRVTDRISQRPVILAFAGIAVAVLVGLLLLIATSCGASEPEVVEVPVEKVVEVVKEVPVEVVKEVPVEKVVEVEVVREVPVEVEVVKEVVKEVPVEKEVIREVVVTREVVTAPPFELRWAASASSVSGGDSFILTVRMYSAREAGERGGISVSFPSLTESGGSTGGYSSSLADVEAVEYTSGLSNVAFHQPGASIYRSDNSTQFPANHLLVESDDATWSTSDDRTLRLRITPKRGGEFPIRVRGWLCADGYTSCSRSPAEADVTDQQGWGVEVAAVAVSGDAGQASTVSDPISLSAGFIHTCGLRSDDSAVCWGDNVYGRTTLPSDEKFISISAGGEHTCGLRSDGAAVCWGNNKHGGASAPFNEKFISISAGDWYTCGLRSDGAAVCWGKNEHGQASPPSDEKFISISSGAVHACGLRSDGSAMCWGWNYYGQTSPSVGSFTAISAGWGHICGLRSDGAAVCWGKNEDSQASPSAGSFTAISAGWNHTCGLRSDGAAVCWGDNGYGQASAPPGKRFTAISAGGYHTCGLQADSLVVCWGSNEYGQSNPRELQ